MTLTQGTPKTFQTEHALVGGRKLSAFRYHYITCPKRLPRKLKKKMRKLEKEVDKVLGGFDMNEFNRDLFYHGRKRATEVDSDEH